MTEEGHVKGTGSSCRPAAKLGAKLAAGCGLAFALAVCFALPARADKNSEAREQFEHAVQMRTQLEGYLEKDRALPDYKQTVAAYHKVYLISTQSDEATPALVAEGQLYEEMGRLYDPKYFQSAIDVYNFLLQQYPGSRYRGEALFSIAKIQKNDLNRSDLAAASYRDYLKRFPHSERSDDARAALHEIENPGSAPSVVAASVPAPVPSAPAPSAPTVENPPDVPGQRVDAKVSSKNAAIVKSVQTWSSPDATRIIIALDNTIKYDAFSIAAPDRIYFDLSNAHLGPKLADKTFDAQSGLLRSLRVAQNKPDVVRVVLDVAGAKNYSAFLVADPYRLVIDVHSTALPSSSIAASAIAPPAAASVAAKPESAPPASLAASATATAATTASLAARSNKVGAGPVTADAPAVAKMNSLTPKPNTPKLAALAPPPVPKPTHDGQQSLTRALGLKIGRIVIDPGHGGHDTGTIGPHGLMEKDLCLDVALRLGKIIEEKLPGAEVIYTRHDDTFVPLEERTAIANQAKADLFISIHANSSHDPDARGIETYYLNFANNEESMEVAARENAESQQSLHDLQDLIKKIAQNEKIEESKELAGDIQNTLTQRLQLVSHSERNRGVKKAPFVVLIGADMPSVLSEISFVSNPNDEKLLRKADQRQRIADGLYRGISTYLDSMNSLAVNQHKFVSENNRPDEAMASVRTVSSAGNPK